MSISSNSVSPMYFSILYDRLSVKCSFYLSPIASTYTDLKSTACLKVQVTQIFEVFYYLHNLLLFIFNDLAEANIFKISSQMAIFIDLKRPSRCILVFNQERAPISVTSHREDLNNIAGKIVQHGVLK